jgi:hypothetical protein
VAVVRTPRILVVLFALVAAVDVAAGGAGALSLLLYAAPLLALAALLASGRFIGEERIIARRRARGVPKLRLALRVGWAGRPARPLTSLLERAPRSLRGPPAQLALV